MPYTKVLQRRREVFKSLKCAPMITEALVDENHPLENGCFGFVVEGAELRLAKGRVHLISVMI